MRETLVVLASVSSGDSEARCGVERYRNRTNQREARGDFSPSPPRPLPVTPRPADAGVKNSSGR